MEVTAGIKVCIEKVASLLQDLVLVPYSWANLVKLHLLRLSSFKRLGTRTFSIAKESQISM